MINQDQPEPIEAWRCGECGDAYTDQEDALECCPPPPLDECWMCRECEAVHDEREDARLCCHDEDGRPRPPSPAELEAAGQTRLAL